MGVNGNTNSLLNNDTNLKALDAFGNIVKDQ